MRNHPGEALHSWRRVFLASAGVFAFAVPLVVGVLAAPWLRAQAPAGTTGRPSFDVASVKPNKSGDNRAVMMPQTGGRFSGTNVSLQRLIAGAYQSNVRRIIAGPEWNRLLAEAFDIEAKAAGNPSKEQMNLMTQSLLEDRFKLVVHHETRQLPVYALVLLKAGKTGPQLTPHSDAATCIDPTAGPQPVPGPGEALPVRCGGFSAYGGPLGMRNAANKITMDMLAAQLGNYVISRDVVDRTGLQGAYDLTLGPFHVELAPTVNVNATDPSAPSIFEALQKQLGLKLESQTGPVDVLVIDHVEEPSPN